MTDNSDRRGLSDDQRAAIAQRLREIVELFGSQADAAEAAHVTVRQLKYYLAGESVPSFPAAAHLAESTGYSVDWLMTGEGDKKRSGPTVQQRPLDRQVELYQWRARALQVLRTELPVLFSSTLPAWSDDIEDDIGGAMLALVERTVPSFAERDGALRLVIEGQRIALAAVRGEALPDYGPVE